MSPTLIQYALPSNVYDAALNRIRWLYDEFEGNVTVSSSGGKDSTVVLNLAIQVAKEKGCLPVRVQWLDQECEFEATVDYQRRMMHRPEVLPEWYQIPFRLFNATSAEETFLNVWGEGEEWVRDKEPDSIHVNDFGTDRFVPLLEALGNRVGGCLLTGVRAEESPARRLGLTTQTTYKWATWGKKNRKHVAMHPIYDWTYRDVWKAISSNGWEYNRMYDLMHRYGIGSRQMRVSNYHHETAVHALFFLQEIEPQTWEKATKRLRGISTAGHLGKADYFVHDLPFMFRDWHEYRDYLLQHLITDEALRDSMAAKFAALDEHLWYTPADRRAKVCVQTILANDAYFTKIDQFIATFRLRDDVIRERGLVRP